MCLKPRMPRAAGDNTPRLTLQKVRCKKREIGSIDFQSKFKIHARRRIAKNGDRARGMRFVCVPRLDALEHEGLLPRFPPPLAPIIRTHRSHVNRTSVRSKAQRESHQLSADVSSFEVISYLKL